MKTILVQCNTKSELILTHKEIEEGLLVCLVDSKNAPIARYGFEREKLKNVKKLSYKSCNARIKFHGIIPTMISELDSVNDEQ